MTFLGKLTAQAVAATAAIERATEAVTRNVAARRGARIRGAGEDSYRALQDAAEPFGSQYASAGFERRENGAMTGGFLTAAYARDIVKMYAMALRVVRTADGQLPGVLQEALRSIAELERFWSWAGFAQRYGSIEALANQELGGMPRAGGYGKRPTPGASPQSMPSSLQSYAQQTAKGALRW